MNADAEAGEGCLKHQMQLKLSERAIDRVLDKAYQEYFNCTDIQCSPALLQMLDCLKCAACKRIPLDLTECVSCKAIVCGPCH